MTMTDVSEKIEALPLGRYAFREASAEGEVEYVFAEVVADEKREDGTEKVVRRVTGFASADETGETWRGEVDGKPLEFDCDATLLDAFREACGCDVAVMS